jgi:hypothetical protein
MTTAADGRSAAASKAAPTAQLDEHSTVVFFDIDNTLHASDAYFFDGRVITGSPASTLFEFAPILEQLLTPYPSLAIIVSSSWVGVLGYEIAVAQLPSDSLPGRVCGATFEREDAADDGWSALPRGAHVLRFVRRHELKQWLAIDDMRDGFERYEAQLVRCQVGLGHGDRDVQRMLARRLEAMFGQSDSFPLSGASTPERPT